MNDTGSGITFHTGANHENQHHTCNCGCARSVGGRKRLLNGGEGYATKPEEWQLLPEMRKLRECMEEINGSSSADALKER